MCIETGGDFDYSVVMPAFVRASQPGGTFFFTLVTYQRRHIFADASARAHLRRSILETRQRRPFDMPAVVLLPNHLHALWTLPEGDADFSTRWRKIKEGFTRAWLRPSATAVEVSAPSRGREAAVTADQQRQGRRGVWQPRYWEHQICDDRDFYRHVDYIHYNPVKHGVCRCPHAWRWSSFHRWAAEGDYDAKWCCDCDDAPASPPDFGEIERFIAE